MPIDAPRPIKLSEYRAPDFEIQDVLLDFVLEPEATRVTSHLQMRRLGADDAVLQLDGEALELISVALDGRELEAADYALDETHLTLRNLPEIFALEIITRLSPLTNTTLEGLYLASGIFCTQCEAEGFRRITYFLDRPDVLAVYRTRIEADKALYPVLLSNGNLIESGDLPNGRHFALWQDPFPKPCYLFALVAGNLGHIADSFTTMSGRVVDLRIFVEHGNEPKARYAMEALKRAMAWDEQAYGREYDLDIFMIVAVSAFNFGAMENKGLNIFNDKLLLASPDSATDDDYARIESVVAHEYFHNWTGDRITCRDWFQLSLKEGLTVYRDQRFSQDMRSKGLRIDDVKMLRMRQFREDAGPLAHPVQPQEYISIDNFYTATIYEKGAEVIGMLETLVGAAGYRKATDLYFERHDGEAATVEDWVKCFEESSGRDLTQFRLWYRQAGTPRIVVRGAYDAAAKTYVLDLSQSLAATPGQPDKLPMHIPLRLGLLRENGAPQALTLEGENKPGPLERVVELRAAEARFVFVGVEMPPLLSIGRHFSAPVIFEQDVSRAARALLMAHDVDGFNRWEQGQALASDLLQEMARHGGGKTDPIYIEAIGEVLNRAEEDHAFAARMLMPPLESEIAQAMLPVDPEAIHRARGDLIRAVADAYGAQMLGLYNRLADDGPYLPDAGPAGRRALRNALLRYLTAADDDAAAALAETHYQRAGNMTDMIAGLAALSRMETDRRVTAFAHFETRFNRNALVLDKWMGLQAGSPRLQTAEEVRALMQHPHFDFKNPNRVRSLVGAFSGNHLRFHAKGGAGYALVGEVMRHLDALNPKMSAGMAGAFENWRRYDEPRQKLMRQELQQALEMPALSPNLFEVARKMLG